VAKQLGLTDDIKLGAVGAAQARAAYIRARDILRGGDRAVYLDGGHAAAAEFVARN